MADMVAVYLRIQSAKSKGLLGRATGGFFD